MSPSAGARSTAGSADVYRDMAVAPAACAHKAALHLLGLLPVGRAPAAVRGARRPRAAMVIRSMLERHGLLQDSRA